MPIYDVYGERKRMAVREETWGHLAPKFNHKYRGHILIATSPYSQLGWTVIEDRFEGLENSPWQHDAMVDFLNDLTDGLEDGAVYLWRGTFEFFRPAKGDLDYLDRARYRFRGKARRVYVPALPGEALRRTRKGRARDG